MSRAESPTQVGTKISLQVWVFEMALRELGTGGATYADVLARLRRLLATGTSPTELLEILRRRQLINPLPESAHGVFDVLNDAIRGDAAEAVVPTEVQYAGPQAVAPHEEVVDESITRKHADHEAPTPSRERTREPESDAGARPTALAADLAAAQASLAAERRRIRNLDLALAEKNAAAEASRTRVDEILRDYEHQKSETRAMRDALAERDTQLAAQQQEHAKVVSTFGARADTGAQLEADLRAALAHADAISLELKVGQETAALLNARLMRSESSLNAALAELGAVKTQSSSYLELLQTREWRREFDHNMFRELDAQVGMAGAVHHALESERDRLQGQLAAADSERARLTAELATRHPALLQAQERAASDAQREQEMGVLMAQLQEARRPLQAFEADVKRLTEELAAKDAAAAALEEEKRQLSATLEWTRGALEESESSVCRLERSESNNADVLGRIQAGIERLKSQPGEPTAAVADPGAAASGAADRSGELIRIDGEQTTTYVLAKRTRIGRAAGCELQINSNSVSRHHAIVIVGPRDTIIEDLNSTNGLFVNGQKVTRHVVNDGDTLTIGETRFRYFARPHEGPPGPHSVPDTI
jgi:chromosome segregation ATPase